MIVWLTRPRRRALPLARDLKRRGLRPLMIPAMRIEGIVRNPALAAFAGQNADMAIFVSAEAAERCQNISAAPPIPAFAVGNATLRALRAIPAFAPRDEAPGDAEALLALPALRAAAAQRLTIAVVGGIDEEDPDTLSPRLCAGLRELGATPLPLPVYRRLPPRIGSLPSPPPRMSAAVAYSARTAANMLKMAASDSGWLVALPLFVIHPQIERAARNLGYQDIRLAAPADMANEIEKALKATRGSDEAGTA